MVSALRLPRLPNNGRWAEVLVLGYCSNIKAGYKDPVASADPWKCFEDFSESPSTPRSKASGSLLGNFQEWSRLSLRTMLTSSLIYLVP